MSENKENQVKKLINKITYLEPEQVKEELKKLSKKNEDIKIKKQEALSKIKHLEPEQAKKELKKYNKKAEMLDKNLNDDVNRIKARIAPGKVRDNEIRKVLNEASHEQRKPLIEEIKKIEIKKIEKEAKLTQKQIRHLITDSLKTKVNQSLISSYIESFKTNETLRFVGFYSLIDESLKIAFRYYYMDVWNNSFKELRFNDDNFDNEWSIYELTTKSINNTVNFRVPVIETLKLLQGSKYKYVHDESKIHENGGSDFKVTINFNFGKLVDNYYPVSLQFEFENMPQDEKKRKELAIEIPYCFLGNTITAIDLQKRVKLPDILKIKTISGKFKASGHYYDQKLKHNYERDTKQINLFDSLENPRIRNQIKDEIIAEGIRLSQSEDRLVMSIINLLNKKTNDYKGNLPAKKRLYGKNREDYPRLRITPSELYREYTERKNPPGKDIKEIKECLLSLQDKKFLIIYKKYYWKKDGKGINTELHDRVEEYQPLLKVINFYEGLTEEEGKNIKPGEISERGELILELNPIFTDQIDTKFIEYPSDINRLTAIASGGYKKVTESIIRMRDYLMRELSDKRRVCEINEDKLHYQLGLDNYIKAKRKKLINLRVNEAIEFSKKYGLAKEVKKVTGAKGQDKYVFILNLDVNKQP